MPSPSPSRAALEPPTSLAPAAAPDRPLAENPPWGYREILALIGAMFAGLLFAALILAGVAHRLFLERTPFVELMTKPAMVVGAQGMAYIFVLVLMYRIAGARGASPLKALEWNWPQRWPAFLGYGVLMAITLQSLEHLLPMPKSVPMDRFFETPALAWMLSIFAVLIAPPLEELFFRGFLYPVLARSLGIFTSIAITSLAFGAVHSDQLNHSWGPLLIIVMVGAILTTVRAFLKSVAATVLMHMGYNFTIMIALFIGTDGFRHLDKMRD